MLRLEPEAQAETACGGWLVRCQLNERGEKNIKKINVKCRRLRVGAALSRRAAVDSFLLRRGDGWGKFWFTFLLSVIKAR